MYATKTDVSALKVDIKADLATLKRDLLAGMIVQTLLIVGAMVMLL